ncbi:biotin/lipoyl-binding protein [bacterium]|nr:biotin/lipoyl-binding protein [bacterium]
MAAFIAPNTATEIELMKNYLIPAAAVVVLTLATASIVRTQPQRQTAEPPIAPPRATFEKRVAAVGLVEASSENISLSAHIPGVVEKVCVTVGQDVKAGDPLVKLDTRALEAQLRERRSDLATRQAAVATAKARAQATRVALAEAQRILKSAQAVADPRSISADELTRRSSAVDIARADVDSADAEVSAADAAVGAAEAAINAVETDIARSTITAPIDGQILQLKIRPGEYAAAGNAAQPWLVMGRVNPLNVRVDVDEHEAWRVQPTAPAVAQVRGNANLSTPLKFVRFEPYVVPKTSLTGASNERVDTRVMQAIYRVERADLPLFVGQQMDVFIDASGMQTAMVDNQQGRP